MTYELLIKKRKIIVSAMIESKNESRDFNFILDTGASKTIISERVAIRLGYELYRLQKGDTLMTAGGAVNSKVLKLPKFSLFGKDMVDFEVNIRFSASNNAFSRRSVRNGFFAKVQKHHV